MDFSEQFKTFKGRLTQKEAADAEKSYAQIKEAEALFAENPAALQAFLHGVRKAQELSIAIESGESDPFLSIGLVEPDNAITATEIHEALRASVNAGHITVEQATTFQKKDWLSATADLEFLLASPDEEFPPYIHSVQPELYSPLTPQSLISHLDSTRAAKDRYREMTLEATWQSLKEKLIEVFNLISVDAENLHRKQTLPNPSSSPDFRGIVELLSQMPKRFRRKAFCKLICGYREFMRIPVLISGPGRISAEPLDIRLPMCVPFPTSNACPTILTWFDPDTGEWQYDLPSADSEIHTPETLFDMNFESLERFKDASHLSTLIRRSTPSDVGEAWINDKITQDALRAVSPASAGNKNDPWYCVIRKARTIFGWDTSAEALLKFLGITMKPRTNELECAWKYAPLNIPDKPRYLVIFKELRRQKLIPTDVSAASPQALARLKEIL